MPKLTISLIALIALVACATRHDRPLVQDVQELNDAIRVETDSAERVNKVFELYLALRTLAENGRSDEIPDSVVDTAIELLSTEDAYFTACLMLLEIGPRSRRAIPHINARINALEVERHPLGERAPAAQRMRTCLAQVSALEEYP